jgi:mycobactin polyketide synthetase MbtD
LAAQLRANGLDCTAIRWGLWQDAGVVETGEISRTERSGLVAMQAEAALDASLAPYKEDPLIFAADFDRLRVFFQSQGTLSSFGRSPNGDTAPARNHFSTKPLAEVVRSELAATLQLGDVSVDPSVSLIDLGLDSLLALDLRRRLRRSVGRSAPVAQMLGGITVSELIDVMRPGETPERLDFTRD